MPEFKQNEVDLLSLGKYILLAVHQAEFVFGGSFDPVHLGHINLLTHLQAFSQNWRVRLLPCATPSLKAPTIASYEQRVAMLKVSFGKAENLIIDQRENTRKGKSYTFDSLRELRHENSETRLVLVLGADAINSINQWYRCEQLSQLCHLMIVNRPGNSLSKAEIVLQKLGYKCAINKQQLEIDGAGRYYCLTIEERAISSTEIRKRLAEKLSVNDLLSAKVIDYIDDHQPY